MKIKINTYFYLDSTESGGTFMRKPIDSETLGLSDEKTKQYAQLITNIIDKSPELMKDTIKTF